MVKIYGSSDDLVCLDNSTYGVDEIGCFDVKGVRLFLDDDTILVVRYTNGMFYDCTSLEDASPIKNWDISAVTSRYKMFYNCPCGDFFASAA